MAKINVPKRSRRRADLQRMKAKAVRLTKEAGGGNWTHCYNNLAVCSCWMCGNPRKFFGEATMQEKRASNA